MLVQPSGQGNADLGGGPDPREKALKRASALAKVGRLSAAVKCLESFLDERDNPLPAPDRLAVLHKLAELHPAGTADDELPVQDVSSLPTGAILSVQEVQEGIDKAPRGSAATMSGWTFDLIAQLADDSAAGRAFTAALTEVYNLILAGKGVTLQSG